jgi:hypothetical protein
MRTVVMRLPVSEPHRQHPIDENLYGSMTDFIHRTVRSEGQFMLDDRDHAMCGEDLAHGRAGVAPFSAHYSFPLRGVPPRRDGPLANAEEPAEAGAMYENSYHSLNKIAKNSCCWPARMLTYHFLMEET